MDFQGFGQIQGMGDANILPPIQGNTQVLPAISPDNLGGVLQQTAGFAGAADANGFFGTTATTNDIFGDTLKTTTETNDFQNFQGTTTDANAFLGNVQAFPGATTDTTGFFGAAQGFTTSDPIFANQTLAGTQFLPTATGTTDPNAMFGATQVLPGQGIQQTTTTTTQTTYNTQGFGIPNQLVLDANNLPETIGTYSLPSNAIQSEYPATGPTTADANIGYGTTMADYYNAQANLQNTTTTQTMPIETIPPNPPTTFTELTPVTQTTAQTAITQQAPTIAIPPPQPEPQPIPQPIPESTIQTIPQQTTQIVQNTAPVQPQMVQANLPILQSRFGKGIMDEDFRRGRPIYTNDAGGYGKILLSRKNNNLPVRPSYNVGVYNTPKLLNYQNVGVNKINNNVNVNAGAGLDRLGRGGSYDVYGRGITPLLNKAGLGQVQTTSKINDFL